MAERLAVNQEVRGSKPRRGASHSSRCGADGSARDLGSRGRRFETCHRDQTVVRLGVAVATEEPWVVNPLVPVRLRPVTPKRMCKNASRTRVAENRALPRTVRVQAPGDAPDNPLVAESADAPVSETGATRHVRSTRTEGTRYRSPVAQRQSSALIRRRPVDRAHPGRPGHHRPIVNVKEV